MLSNAIRKPDFWKKIISINIKQSMLNTIQKTDIQKTDFLLAILDFNIQKLTSKMSGFRMFPVIEGSVFGSQM